MAIVALQLSPTSLLCNRRVTSWGCEETSSAFMTFVSSQTEPVLFPFPPWCSGSNCNISYTLGHLFFGTPPSRSGHKTCRCCPSPFLMALDHLADTP